MTHSATPLLPDSALSPSQAASGLPCVPQQGRQRPWVLRRARGSDACGVQALYAQFVNNPALQVCPKRLDSLADDPDHHLWVAEAEGRLWGTVLLCLCRDVMFGDRPFAVLENLVVDAQARGQGLGRALLAEVEALCAARHASKIMITSGSHRAAAHGFFLRQGYCAETKKSFIKYQRDFKK
jgi:GNAT superfamily N-acetyltransferase